MKTYLLEIFIEGECANGDEDVPVNKHGEVLHVSGDNIDAVRANAKKLIQDKHLPPIRTMNFSGDKLLVYLGEHPQRANANVETDFRPTFKQPPRMMRR